ncbi:SIS domain-containing protein [Enterococcus thailandicus]|uniref:SIS domain-containing protein n=1 Tax=Enterococcus thailandicus TaxID=417368 RepID=UPI0022EBA4E6|nr:SIS domain-containing protein [Enterococcus thailandicus]MDA3964453.1 SIS domain-containing protein [Enterococcus thailandicus]
MLEQKTKLKELGAAITASEIQQQPELWQETVTIMKEKKEKLKEFFEKMDEAADGKRIRVIFTGAGTSQYVGDTIVPYLNGHGETQKFIFQSIGTTDIVAAPQDYLIPDEPTLLVSFARSGNSPESLAAVELANQVVSTIFHLTITCAAEGSLAKAAEKYANNFLLLMPEKSNDAGFAMTGSFTCMMLSALLIFDQTPDETKEKYVTVLSTLGKDILNRATDIKELISPDFQRIVYLGSGSLAGLAREAQLKILELTAGKVATSFDSSMGFRHGPKSFVNDETLVFVFVNNQPYTRTYDLDILEEIHGDKIAKQAIAIAQPGKINYSGQTFQIEATEIRLPDGYLSLAMILVAQLIALLTSIKIGNTPDTPSPSGTVNRVVKGVTIHDYPGI